nr:DUF1989 domain-containing protein [Acuticoccus mangrovi]
MKAAGQTEGAFEARRDAAPRLGAIPADAARFTDEIPADWYWHGHVAAGEILSIDNPAATPGASLILWSAVDPSERLNPADTIKVQWTAAIGRGRVLLSDMGRAMASVVDGPDAAMDFVAGGSTAFSAGPGRFNARDHFIKAAAKHGLGKRDVGPVMSLFAPVVTDAEGNLVWGDAPLAGRVDLLAEMDLIAAVANCPHPLAPSAEARPITITLWRPASAPDFCRTATPEAERAFINNEAGR